MVSYNIYTFTLVTNYSELNNYKMKKKNKHTLLKGEGTNQHTLYGDFKISNDEDFTEVQVLKSSLLKHEQPDGSFSNEHQALQIEEGNWVKGKQVEYNPFTRTISQIWD